MATNLPINLGWYYYKAYYDTPCTINITHSAKIDDNKPSNKSRRKIDINEIVSLEKSYVEIYDKRNKESLKDEISSQFLHIIDEKQKRDEADKIYKQIQYHFFEKKNKMIKEFKHPASESNPISLNFASKIEFRIIAPGILSGIGINHNIGGDGEFKLGFMFDHTSGLPYLPGSSVKGAIRSIFPNQLRKTAVELSDKPLYQAQLLYIAKRKEDYFIKEIQNISPIEIFKLEYLLFEGVNLSDDDIESESIEVSNQHYTIFKIKNTPPRISPSKQVVFLDAFIRPNASASCIFNEDFITPHKYKDRTKRHLDQYSNPTPIQFLKIVAENFLICQFYNVNEKTLELFAKILNDVGVGAKTSVGYGQLGKVKILKESSESKTESISATIIQQPPVKSEPPHPKITEKDYDFINGHWYFKSKLKLGVYLEAKCLEADLINSKIKRFKLLIGDEKKEVFAKCSYSDMSIIGKYCIISVKSLYQDKVKDIEFIKLLKQ